MKKERSANYAPCTRKEPIPRMGQGNFANLPDNPMIMPFGSPTYRDGVINDFDSTVDEISRIHENQR